jgi:HEAT repeat protein
MHGALARDFNEQCARVQTAYVERNVDYLIASLRDRTVGGPNKIKLRAVAARLLGKLRDERAVGPLGALLSDNDWYVRAVAAGSLGHIGDPDAVPDLVRLTLDSVWQVREAAGAALGRIRDGRATPALAAMLDEPRRQTRRLAARSLAQAGDGRALDALRRSGSRESLFRRLPYLRAARAIRRREAMREPLAR